MIEAVQKKCLLSTNHTAPLIPPTEAEIITVTYVYWYGNITILMDEI